MITAQARAAFSTERRSPSPKKQTMKTPTTPTTNTTTTGKKRTADVMELHDSIAAEEELGRLMLLACMATATESPNPNFINLTHPLPTDSLFPKRV